MNTETGQSAIETDSAAIFACAQSLWETWQKHAASDPKLNLSEAYNGMDQFMREIMRAASQFEAWACLHINFDGLNEPWPYLLQDHFGETCLQVLAPPELAAFNEKDCLRVAIRMRLPVKPGQNLPVPVHLCAANPSFGIGSEFQEIRLQTIRDFLEDDECFPFTAADDPFDAEYSAPYFGLHGLKANGLLEPIANRRTLPEAIQLAKNLWPALKFLSAEGRNAIAESTTNSTTPDSPTPVSEPA